MTVTDPRPSMLWQLDGHVTDTVRDVFAETLGAVFADENDPRAIMPPAPDVTIVAVPQDGQLTVVAHFAGVVDVPDTRVDWLDQWVQRAAAEAGMVVRQGPKWVRVGL